MRALIAMKSSDARGRVTAPPSLRLLTTEPDIIKLSEAALVSLDTTTSGRSRAPKGPGRDHRDDMLTAARHRSSLARTRGNDLNGALNLGDCGHGSGVRRSMIRQCRKLVILPFTTG